MTEQSSRPMNNNHAPTDHPGRLPPPGAIPAELLSEAETDRPPASLEELRDMVEALTALLRQHNDLFTRVFQKNGEQDQRFEKLEAAQAKHAEFQDKRLDEIKSAAQTAADGALAASAQMQELRDSLASQDTHDKTRVAELELKVDGLAERVERVERVQGAGQ